MSLCGHFILYNSSVKRVLHSRTSGSMGHRAVRQTRNQPPLRHSDFRKDRGWGWGALSAAAVPLLLQASHYCGFSRALLSGTAPEAAPSRHSPARQTSLVRAQGGADSARHPRPPHPKCSPRVRPISHMAEPDHTRDPHRWPL